MRSVALKLALVTVTVGMGAPSAVGRVPGAETMLQRARGWASALPGESVRYRLRADGADAGYATLTAARVVLSDREEPQGRATTLWSELLRGAPKAALVRAGVALEETHLHHLRRRVVVVVGAKPLQVGRPQVWFDRDTGAVVRVSLPGDDGVEALEADGPWPPVLRWTRGGARLLTGHPAPPAPRPAPPRPDDSPSPDPDTPPLPPRTPPAPDTRPAPTPVPGAPLPPGTP